MASKERLLLLLEQRRGDYRSGEDLAADLNVSRAAVWKAVQALRREGHPIDAVTNRGYRLRSEGDVLTAAGVRKYLSGVAQALEITVEQIVPSTNARLRELAAAGAAQGTALLSGAQTQGRGRYGRAFFSPAGTGVYMSLLLRPAEYAPDRAALLTAAAAVAMCRALEDVTGKSAGIKWVNDVLVDGKKVCGILTEGSFSLENGALEYLVLGAGVNLYRPQEGFPPELADIAGAVLDEPLADGKNRLAGAFLSQFWDLYTHPEDAGFIDEYRRRSLVVGRPVIMLQNGAPRPAQALDIDERCRLLVRYETGEVQALSYGEVQVKL